MSIEWLITDVTACWSPSRAESAFLGWFWTFSWPVQAAFVAREPLFYLETLQQRAHTPQAGRRDRRSRERVEPHLELWTRRGFDNPFEELQLTHRGAHPLLP